MDYNQVRVNGVGRNGMSQNTRLLLIALVVMVVFGIFLQSLIAKSLQQDFGENQKDIPRLPSSINTKPLPGIEPVPGAAPMMPGGAKKPAEKGK